MNKKDLENKVNKRIKSLGFTMEEYIAYLIHNDINAINELGEGFYYNMTLNKVINPNHKEINLTNTQLKILTLLLENKGDIIDIDTIKTYAWNKEQVSIYTLRNMIKSIRDKTFYEIIVNHSNKGYSLGL